jgi:hypothetical protein
MQILTGTTGSDELEVSASSHVRIAGEAESGTAAVLYGTGEGFLRQLGLPIQNSHGIIVDTGIVALQGHPLRRSFRAVE